MFIFTYFKREIWATVLRTLALIVILLIFIFNMKYLPLQIHLLQQGAAQGIQQPYFPTLLDLLGLPPRAHVFVEITFLCVIFFSTVLFGILAFRFRSDAWLAFFLIGAIAIFFTPLHPTPLNFLSRSYLSAGAILLLILFPNGQLRPKWSWLLLFLSCEIIYYAGTLGISTQIVYEIFYRHDLELFLIIAGGVVYSCRKSFTIIERRWIILFFGAAVISAWDKWLVYFGVSNEIINKIYMLTAPLFGNITTLHYPILGQIEILPLLAVVGVVAYRYRNAFTPIERQQTKWLVFGFAVSIPFAVVLKIFQGYFYLYLQPGQLVAFRYMIDRLCLFSWVALIFAIVVALRRYRLWDVDMFINRALIYGGLVVTVGILCLSAVIFIDQTIKSESANQDAFLIISTSIFLIVVTYKPMRIWLQRLANKCFPPDQLNFTEAFLEFTPDLRGYFTQPALLKILTQRSVEQMEVSHASTFIKNKSGKLQHIKTVTTGKKALTPIIKKQALFELEKGEIVTQDVNSGHSIIIPLVVPRGQRLDFIGALLLGPRLNGLGYSTEMKEQLKKFGKEVGTSLYIAQIKRRR